MNKEQSTQVDPKFHKGDKVVSKLDDNLICIVESQCPITKLYQLYTGGSAVIHRAEQYLEPYTEPESQNPTENCDNGNLNSNCDKPKDNHLKDTMDAKGHATQWRSVEDELPKLDDDVLVVYSRSYTPAYKELAVAYYNGEDWYTQDGDHIRPSHWMPIPELP